VFGPVRTLTSARPGANPAVLAATAAVTGVFSATPFLIPVIAVRFGVTEGTAGLISVAQVGGFAVASLVLPRLWSPDARIFRTALVTLAVANAASALMPVFPGLVAMRTIAGISAGALAWIGWADAMQSSRSLASISAAGPLAALMAAPIVAALAGSGIGPVFVALTAVAIPALVLSPPNPRTQNRRGERSRSRSNRVLLGALWLTTFAGSALFIFEAVTAREMLGMSALAVSLAFSANAAAGLLGARLASRHRRPGVFLATTGPAALLTVFGGHAVWFYLGMAWWGFAFWMGIPGVMEMLAARSLQRGERAGDAQGLMAFGRTLGPLLGGSLIDAGSLSGLAMAASAGLTVSGLMVVGVQEGRELLPPSDDRLRV
jgi:predicted MFS family arabinose efflux permease